MENPRDLLMRIDERTRDLKEDFAAHSIKVEQLDARLLELEKAKIKALALTAGYGAGFGAAVGLLLKGIGTLLGAP